MNKPEDIAPVATPEVKPVDISIKEVLMPPMLPRPEGMTRQMQRRLYRQACKRAGVSWRRDPASREGS